MALKKISEGIASFAYPVSRYLQYVGSFFLIVLMMLVVVHVVGRYFLNIPVPGAIELIEFMMTFVVFLSFGYCAVKRGNVKVDLVIRKFPKRAQAFIDAATCILGIGIITLIAWQGLVQAKSLWASGHVSGVLHIPHYPFLFVLGIGCVVYDLVLVEQFFEYLNGAFEK